MDPDAQNRQGKKIKENMGGGPWEMPQLEKSLPYKHTEVNSSPQIGARCGNVPLQSQHRERISWKVPGACSPDSLAKSASSQFIERSCLKKSSGAWSKKTPGTSLWHSHLHLHAHTEKNVFQIKRHNEVLFTLTTGIREDKKYCNG